MVGWCPTQLQCWGCVCCVVVGVGVGVVTIQVTVYNVYSTLLGRSILIRAEKYSSGEGGRGQPKYRCFNSNVDLSIQFKWRYSYVNRTIFKSNLQRTILIQKHQNLTTDLTKNYSFLQNIRIPSKNKKKICQLWRKEGRPLNKDHRIRLFESQQKLQSTTTKRTIVTWLYICDSDLGAKCPTCGQHLFARFWWGLFFLFLFFSLGQG